MAAATTQPLSSIYPVNSLMELTLNNDSNETTQGTIYCTDEVSNTIVLKKSLLHTTLSSEITVINAAVVTGRRIITDQDESAKSEDKMLLPSVSRRMVEERERRAIRLMEESFSHVNQQVSSIALFVCLIVS